MFIAGRRFIVILCSLFVLPLGALSDDAIPKPVIVIDSPVFSFGSVPQGALVKHDFLVKNTGTMDLIIQKVTPSCGCTAALPPNGPIPAGQSAAITVSFDTSGFEGDKEKTVRVFSNDIDNPQPVLTLKGRIDTALVIDPVRVSFGDVMQSEFVKPADVSIKVKDGVEGTIKEIATFSKALTVTTKSNDGKNAVASVGLSSQLLPGELRDRVLITLAYKDGREQTFNIPVIGNVAAGVVIQPRTLSFGVLEGPDPIIRNAKVVGVGKDSFDISSVESDSDNVHVSYKAVKPGQIYVLTITVDPKDFSLDLRAVVKVTTTSKEQPSLTLNVYGIVPPKK